MRVCIEFTLQQWRNTLWIKLFRHHFEIFLNGWIDEPSEIRKKNLYWKCANVWGLIRWKIPPQSHIRIWNNFSKTCTKINQWNRQNIQPPARIFFIFHNCISFDHVSYFALVRNFEWIHSLEAFWVGLWTHFVTLINIMCIKNHNDEPPHTVVVCIVCFFFIRPICDIYYVLCLFSYICFSSDVILMF